MLALDTKYRIPTAALIAVLVSVVIVPFTAADVFRDSLVEGGALAALFAVRVAFGLLVFAVAYYALRFSERLRAGDRTYRRWLIVSAVYLVINLALLAFIWPGYWVWDEYFVLTATHAGELPSWQNVLTSIYFVLSMLAIPSGVGIVLIQAVVSAIAVGYVVARTASVLRRPRLAYLLLIPLVTAPVLLNNLYPLRLTMYSYLELLVLFRLLFIAKQPELVTNRYRELLVFGAAISLLAFWRTEGIYYLLVIPILLVALRIFRRPARRLLGVATVFAIVAMVGGTYYLTSSTNEPRYQVTASLNPISVMLQHPLTGEHLDENLAAIDRVVDLDIVRQFPSAVEVPSFWKGAVRTDYAEHIGGYNRAFVSLVLENPGAYVDARVQTFLSANSLTTSITQIQRATPFYGERPEPVSELIDTFENENRGAKPLDSDLRSSVVRQFLMIDNAGTLSPLAALVWTIIPVGLLLTAAFVIALVRRKWLYAGIAALILARAALVLVTAPSNYFMYYLPLFLSGWLFVGFLAVRLADRLLGTRVARKKRGRTREV